VTLKITQIPAHPSNYNPNPRDTSVIDLIVIHITDGHGDPLATAGMFATPRDRRDPPRASSAHYVVGQDGTIVQCVPIDHTAYHAHGCNYRSIAIEHCARAPKELRSDDPGLPISAPQYLASARLVSSLCEVLSLPKTRAVIRGHCEADPATSHKDCPNAIWDWAHYMTLVSAT